MIRVLAATERQAQAFMDKSKFVASQWIYARSLKEVLSCKDTTIIAIDGWACGCQLKKMGQKAKLKMFSMTSNNTVIYAEYEDILGA